MTFFIFRMGRRNLRRRVEVEATVAPAAEFDEPLAPLDDEDESSLASSYWGARRYGRVTSSLSSFEPGGVHA